MVTTEIALQTILDHAEPLPNILVSHDRAWGRVLANDLLSGLALPPFDNSAMDGYAVVASDLANTSEADPVRLKLIGIVGAGAVSAQTVTTGHCLKIMTGAPMPAGADAVVMREDTVETDGQVDFLAGVSAGQNVRYSGSDVKLGEVVLQGGSVVDAAAWAMLASLGVSEVEVVERPRVGIIVTGEELVAVTAALKPGQIRDSNSWALKGLVMNCGAAVAAVRSCGDTLEEFETTLREVSSCCDVVITSGGVSVGDFDPVRDVLQAKAEVHFWKIAMKPGKPVMFATFEGKLVFGLPGNPVSVMVAFEEFVRPALLKMAGRRALKRAIVEVRVPTSIQSPAGRTEYVRAEIRPENGEWKAKLSPDQSSGRLSTMTRANALLVVPAEQTFVAKGSLLKARLLNCSEIE